MNPIERAISLMGNATRLAEAMGCSVQAVCFWRDGKRKVDAETAIVMERVTHGVVTCEELCAGADWAYIRGSKRRIKRPAVFQTEIAQAPANTAQPATETVAQGA